MPNNEIAKLFREIADLLELQEESFKPRAYRRAARSIEQLSEAIEDIANRSELERIPGVGKAIAKKIQEFLDTGQIKYLEKLKQEVPTGLVELLQVPALGPKTVRRLYEQLGISSIAQLREAIEEHQLRDLPGFGERSEENLRRSLTLNAEYQERRFIGEVYPVAKRILEELKQHPEVKQIEVAGSLRRWRETIGDIDILVASQNSRPIMNAFIQHPDVSQVLAQGVTKSSIIVKDGIQVDLRIVDPKCYGAALQYFTGSKAHNIALRRIARRRGWKLSEYGLIDTKTNEEIAGRTEESIYAALGLPWIPPELREDTGEIEAAESGNLPDLVSTENICGDLHVHSNWSDGSDSIETMVKAAIVRGYEYLAICDHSSAVVPSGLTEKRFQEQINTIHALDEQFSGIHLLAGTEVEILPDGNLDLSDEVLAETDIVCAAIHGRPKKSESMTERIIQACENEYVDILAHPTGRIIHKQPSYLVDLELVMEVAKRNNILLEINSSKRQDLSAEAARKAKEYGLRFVVNSDAHRNVHLELIRQGVAIARRGWLTPSDVINTNSFDHLGQYLKHLHIR